MITREIILAYERLEGLLFPLTARGKVPTAVGWQKRQYSRKQLLTAVGNGANLGWAIPDGAIVIDIDPRNGGKLETITKYGIEPNVITGGGGYHFYIKLPDYVPVEEIKSQWTGIDIKKRGGYVVTAGSITNREYKIGEKRLRYQACPEKLLKKLTRLKKVSPSGQEQNNEISPKTLKKLLDKLPIKEYDSNEKWFPILAASYNATKGKGFSEFLNWSLGDSKYEGKKHEIKARWDSFRKSDSKEKIITVRTLLKEVQRKSGLKDIVLYDKKDAQNDFADKVKLKKRIDDIAYFVAINVLKNRFANGKHLKHANDLRYWYYNGKYWEVLQPNMIDKYLYEETVRLKLLKPSMRKGIVNVFKTAESILRALVAQKEGLLISDGLSIINCQNGELWINDETGETELRPHNPDSNLTYVISCDYNPEMKCPKFKRALTEIFQTQTGEIIKHLWEVIGYTIQPRKNIASWVLFHGNGSNGKTVILNILSALLGDSVLEKAITDLDTTKNNHALADLPGKLAVIDEDLAANITLPDSLLKKISENKMLTANPKHSMTFRFQSIAIPILASNSWPKTLDLSEGLRRRALVFPFRRQFSPDEQNINLSSQIVATELSGILNEAIAGLQRLRKRGMWKPAKQCEIAKRTWFASNNQVSQFIEESLEKGHSNKDKISFVSIWKKYVSWSYDNGIRMHLPKFRLKEEMQLAGYEFTIIRNRLTLFGYTLA